MDDQLPLLAGSGVVRPTTLLWKVGMPSWVTAGEIKPELFQAELPTVGASMVGESTGLVMDLARTLRGYAGWVAISGWVHGATGVCCIAVGTAMGYFAALRPDRLAEWAKRVPSPLQFAFAHPWLTVVALAGVAILLFFTAAQLIGGAARARRAVQMHSADELRIALRSVGSFFRSTVLTLLLGLLVLAGSVLYHYRPWKKVAPPAPIRAVEPEKERVTI